ncbi:pyridoxal-dependent decarboxylase, exosortase A system-associated [Pelagibius marinus]|uniref:pyridoxal-dependent decarboxylase, exosortase A system-associated n=1 Tax=Pelagibius marinus TaxID=2762760 RepID=UPI0018726FB0|nr:pyridoxal-dependent decarboxylase, exosortase A system-associated [Pelagibius marinus]
MKHWRARNGCLELGGQSLTRLADRVGQTPFFAYDRQLLDERVALLRGCLPVGVRLHYAVKANPMPAVLQHLKPLVDGFDVASAGEMIAALDTGMDPAAVAIAGPGKTDSELRQAIAAGILVEIESENEARRVARLSEDSGYTARVAVRINPDFVLKGAGMRMGGGPQQFGVDQERVPELLGQITSAGLQFEGFHIFAGSQILRSDIICDVQRQSVELVLGFAEQARRPLRYLNIGGGFGIPYFPKDEPLDIRQVGENLHLLAERVSERQPQAEVVVELGRYIVGEAGVYVSRVVDRKESRGQIFLVTDGGLHHQLAASGNFGQVIRRNYPVAIGNKFDAVPTEVASVVGCLCTPLDLLGDRCELPAAEVDDLVVIFQSGAYGRTASPSAFLSHPTAIEVLV